MLKLLIIGSILVCLTIVIHAIGSTLWMRYIVGIRAFGQDGSTPWQALVTLLASAVVLIGLHTIEILVWAFAFLKLVPGQIDTLEEAAYFSFVTYTTLGYGDITLGEQWRLLTGFEAINGILLAGWTTALFFALVQRAWQFHSRWSINNPDGGGRRQQ